ncbi:MAG: hypothetical protein Q8O26_19315 [Phreatobacter sp.]|uniref:hypothetical protein n=1 Tax=Phreatobacter sp. TaxID=1966341 RepID=UPI00273326F1|nr:hypothetical protein [Phreatobacter sp.]MDP2804025.1 hypothetical protein [Phreatobacter sp.]
MELWHLASAALLACIVTGSIWYNRWCDQNGVPRPAGSSGGDGPDFSGDGGE